MTWSARRIRTVVALCLLLAASLAAAWGRKPPKEEAINSVRILTDTEVAGVSRRFPGLALYPQGIVQFKSGLLERLFPRDSFYKTYNRHTDPEIPYLFVISGDRMYDMPNDFNRLLVRRSMKASGRRIADLAKAFIIAVLGHEPTEGRTIGYPGRLDSFPRIMFLGSSLTKRKMGGSLFTTEVDVKVKEQDEKWYFEVWRAQLGTVIGTSAKGVTIDAYFPSVVESLPKQ